MIERFNEEMVKNRSLIDSVNLTLQQLPNTPLHKAFVTESRKTLADVYYPLAKIEIFKTKCIEKEEGLQRKVTEVVTRLKEVKSHIKDAKADRQSKNRVYLEVINQSYNERVNTIREQSYLQLEDMHGSKAILT